MAKRLEDLPIYLKADEFCSAVTATLDRPAFRRNSRLADQIRNATDSVLAKGSVAEALSGLNASRRRRCILERN